MNKNQYILLALVAGLVLVAGVYVAWPKDTAVLPPVSPNGTPAPTPTPTPINPPPPAYMPQDGQIQPVLPLEDQADYIIDITSSGFSPASLTIKQGESIIWTSRDRNGSHQIVSTGSPQNSAMNSTVLKLGESWRATFNSKGTFNYQDKLNSQFKGSIIVE